MSLELTQETLAEIEEELRSGEYAPLADRIHAARKREFGNMAAMRDALMNIAAYAQSAECHTEDSHVLGYLNQVRAWVNSALAEPPRQCDVGNAKEQYKRFYEMCFNRSCTLCHYKFYEGCSRDQCFARWEQTLYEKGGAV